VPNKCSETFDVTETTQVPEGIALLQQSGITEVDKGGPELAT
jgi:hypothetical protein